MKTIRVRSVTRARNRVDIGGQRTLGDRDRGRADRLGADRIHQEAVPAVEHLVARPGIGAQQQADQFVRAGAADDAVRVEPVMAAERGAQFRRAAVGIAVDLLGQRAIGGDRPWGWGRARFRSTPGGSAARFQEPSLRRRHRGRCRGCPAREPGQSRSSSAQPFAAAATIPADVGACEIRGGDNSAAESGTAYPPNPKRR